MPPENRSAGAHRPRRCTHLLFFSFSLSLFFLSSTAQPLSSFFASHSLSRSQSTFSNESNLIERQRKRERERESAHRLKMIFQFEPASSISSSSSSSSTVFRLFLLSRGHQFSNHRRTHLTRVLLSSARGTRSAGLERSPEIAFRFFTMLDHHLSIGWVGGSIFSRTLTELMDFKLPLSAPRSRRSRLKQIARATASPRPS